MNDFICDQCGKVVIGGGHIGTHQRNHCPFCLYSKHVDETKGDRKSRCYGMMEPIGLTFKREKNKTKAGEIMLIHRCQQCEKISINRIAADDSTEEILYVFRRSEQIGKELLEVLKSQEVQLVGIESTDEIMTQLFGKTSM